jgi:hypothetical protein
VVFGFAPTYNLSFEVFTADPRAPEISDEGACVFRNTALVVTLGIFAAAVTQAGETYTIKIKKKNQGDQILHNSDETSEQVITLKDPAGNTLKDETDKSSKAICFREEVLEKQPGEPALRIKRLFEKAQYEKGGQKLTRSYEGKTLIIERKKSGSYGFRTQDGTSLLPEDLQDLGRLFRDDMPDDERMNALLVPRKPVAVCETWKLDMEALAKELLRGQPLEFDGAHGSGIGKLQKAYRKDGRQFGVMEFEMALPLRAVGEGRNRVEMKDGSVAKFTIAFDVCIDGSAHSGTQKGHFSLAGEGKVKGQDNRDYRLLINLDCGSLGANQELAGK